MTVESSRRRFLCVLQSEVFGGPHNRLISLAPLLEESGWTSVALIPSDEGNAASRIRAAGIETLKLDMTRIRKTRSLRHWVGYCPLFLRDVLRLVRLIRALEIDVVAGSGPNLQAAMAARVARRPVVWEVADITTPLPARRLLALLLRVLADAVMVDGDGLIPFYPGLERLRQKLVVFYPPVDLDHLAPPSQRQPPGRVVGTVANLNPDKGIEYLVEAAARVRRSLDARFDVVGSRHATNQRYYENLLEQCSHLGLGDALTFLGPTDDVRSFLHGIDVFVCSSVREGTTTTLLEAMAAGLPVVATRVGAIPDLVDEEVGLLVPPRDPVRLAEAIELLVRDGALRRRLGAAARQRVIERFGIQKTAESQLQALELALRSLRQRENPCDPPCPDAPAPSERNAELLAP